MKKLMTIALILTMAFLIACQFVRWNPFPPEFKRRLKINPDGTTELVWSTNKEWNEQ